MGRKSITLRNRLRLGYTFIKSHQRNVGLVVEKKCSRLKNNTCNEQVMFIMKFLSVKVMQHFKYNLNT